MVLTNAPDLADPSFVEQVRRHVPDGIQRPPAPGPTRAELAEILSEN
jgi:hypothetical protein